MVTRLGALLLGALVLVAPATTEGRSPVPCTPAPSVELPEHGAEDVPTNARLWADRGSELVLLGPDGMEFETTETHIDMFERQELVVLTPVEPLLPEARYQFWKCDGSMCTTLLSQFTTGTEADTTPPALPVETSRDEGRGWVSLSLEFEGVLLASLGDVTLDPATLTGSAHVASAESTVSFGSEYRHCRDDHWPGDARGEQTLRYGAFDLAGNFSGWSEPEPLALIGCGCSANRSTPALPLLVLLFGLTRRRSLARRRRRMRRLARRALAASSRDQRASAPRRKDSKVVALQMQARRRSSGVNASDHCRSVRSTS